jgi:hypothetical protein
MSTSDQADLLLRLINARTTAAVDAILAKLPVVSEDEYHWISNKERYGEWRDGQLHWVPVGRNRGNGGNIKLAGEPFNPIAERVVNGMEALIELMRLLELRDNPKSVAPRSPRDAVERYFGLPKLDLIERMPDADRKILRSIVSQVQKNLKVFLDHDARTSEFAVTVRDYGMGQAPNKMSSTLLSLTESDKPDKPYLVGLFGQGGSSAYAASDYSVILSRRAPQIQSDDGDQGVGWTVVRHFFPKGRRDNYWAYLARSDDGLVPQFSASAANAANFQHGSQFCHIKYDFGGAKSAVSRQIYQTMNHILFNPVMPYELYAMKDRPDSMRGTAQRLAVRAREQSARGALDKAYSNVAVTIN